MTPDVLVIGAGTAGAAAAYHCARLGLKTLCVDRRALDGAGARWVNAVPATSFDEAGLARPQGDERCAEGHAFHLVAGWGPERVTVKGHGAVETDMRLLIDRLQRLALAAGAQLQGDTRVTLGPTGAVQLDGGAQPAEHAVTGALNPRWIVDASGYSAHCANPRPPEHLCAAAQEVRDVHDWTRARGYFEGQGVAPGDTLCFTGVAGGFSIVNVRLEHDGISLLTGSIPGRGYPSGTELLARFVGEQPWIGPRRFGGARVLPLGRPASRLVHGNVLRLGDAAGQVFSAHGSGIGAGMVAARMLAEALSREAPREYAVGWQRRFGGTLAAYDAFRRFSETLQPDDLRALMRAGVVGGPTAVAGLQQVLPSLADLLPASSGALREPRLTARALRVVAKMAALAALYRAYPSEPSGLARWEAAVSRVAGVN